MRKTCLFLFALWVVATASPRPGAALDEQFSTPERLMQWTFTYRSHAQPLRVPKAVRAMLELGLLRDEEKTGFFVGFIAGVLNHNPQRASWLIAHMLPMPPKEQAVIVKAIAYSGLSDWPVLLQKFAPRLSERKRLIDDFLSGREPTLLESPWDPGPPIIYTLWGFFVATGDYEPVKRIISALPWSGKPDVGAFTWKGFLASIGWTDDDSRQIVLERLIIGSTAKWTLVSYAEHHRDLLDLYRAELATRPEKVTRPLKEVIEAAERFEAERVRKEELALVEEMKMRLGGPGSQGSRAAYAGGVGIATACVVAGALGHEEIAVPCVVTGAIYTGLVKLMGR